MSRRPPSVLLVLAALGVDLLLVSDVITLEEAFALLEPLQRRLGRPVSPTLYTSEELERRRRGHHPFLTKVLASEHVVLLGDIDELDTLDDLVRALEPLDDSATPAPNRSC